jgi:hypothetical protein
MIQKNDEKTINVLCVDTDSIWLSMVEKAVRDTINVSNLPGCQIEAYRDIHSAFSRVKERRYDLMISEHMEGGWLLLYDAATRTDQWMFCLLTGNEDVINSKDLKEDTNINIYDKKIKGIQYTLASDFVQRYKAHG